MGSLVRSGIADRSVCPTCNSDQIEEAGALQCLSCGDTFTPDEWNRYSAESFATKGNQQCSHCYELIREACINKACNDEWVCDDCWDCWFCEECKGCTSYHPQKYAGNPCECLNAESFAAQEKKALDGGTIPTPLVWVDGGGQLPYSHVVVDVSGSMMAAQVVPNHSGPETFSRSDYVMFLLLEMYHSGAIKADTRIYPHTSRDWDSFISAGFLFGRGEAYGPEVWPILFEPRAGSTHLDHMGELPHTKTLLITDIGPGSLPRMVGGTWVVNPEWKKTQKARQNHEKMIYEIRQMEGQNSKTAQRMEEANPWRALQRGHIENAPFDIIAW